MVMEMLEMEHLPLTEIQVAKGWMNCLCGWLLGIMLEKIVQTQQQGSIRRGQRRLMQRARFAHRPGIRSADVEGSIGQ